jgi:hypothetical protein
MSAPSHQALETAITALPAFQAHIAALAAVRATLIVLKIPPAA